MLQELLPLLPKEVGTFAVVLAIAGTLVGAGLWLAGSRFSRTLITLLLVSLGGWVGLPTLTRLYLPYACGAALISGLAASLLWPRVGLVLLYSTAGVSLLVGLGLTVVNVARPQWIESLPARSSTQLIIVLAMVAFG